MNFIIVLGPPAVGKMSVGREIEKELNYKLFHNHMSIEMPLEIFTYGTSSFHRLARTIREIVFDEAKKTNMDLIFTYVCGFDDEKDVAYLNQLIESFEQDFHHVYVLELQADLEVRLKRNGTSERLQEKPSKRNIEWSNNNLFETSKRYRLHSFPGEIKCKKHLVIDNTQLSPKEVADMFIKHFDLKILNM